MSRRRSWRSTIWARRAAKSVIASPYPGQLRLEDVVAQLPRRQDRHAAAAGPHDAGPLEVGEEAADALARGAGELGEVRLVHADRHLPLHRLLRLFGDELEQHAGDAAGDRLERLARDPLVGGAQAPHQGADELDGDLGVAGEQRPHLAGRQGEQLAVAERFDAGRANLAVEHCQLAEDVAGAERRQRDRAAVGVLAGDAEAALADDVAGVGAIALVEDAGGGWEGARHGDAREALQLPLLEVGEERHAPQQLDRAQALLIAHRPIIAPGRYRTLWKAAKAGFLPPLASRMPQPAPPSAAVWSLRVNQPKPATKPLCRAIS